MSLSAAGVPGLGVPKNSLRRKTCSVRVFLRKAPDGAAATDDPKPPCCLKQARPSQPDLPSRGDQGRPPAAAERQRVQDQKLTPTGHIRFRSANTVPLA